MSTSVLSGRRPASPGRARQSQASAGRGRRAREGPSRGKETCRQRAGRARRSEAGAAVRRARAGAGAAGPSHAEAGFRGAAGLPHRAMPPSTGTIAPVMPLAPSPARNASTAATSWAASSRSCALLGRERMGRGQPVQAGTLIQDVRRRGTGADRVRRDPGAPQIRGESADETGHPRLGRAVGGQQGQPAGRGGGGDGEEAPVPRLGTAEQRGHRDPGEVQHPAEVDVEHGLLLIGGHLPGGDAAGDHPGDRDGGVEPAPGPFGLPDRRGQCGHVTGIRLGDGHGGAQVRRHLRQVVAVTERVRARLGRARSGRRP